MKIEKLRNINILWKPDFHIWCVFGRLENIAHLRTSHNLANNGCVPPSGQRACHSSHNLNINTKVKRSRVLFMSWLSNQSWQPWKKTITLDQGQTDIVSFFCCINQLNSYNKLIKRSIKLWFTRPESLKWKQWRNKETFLFRNLCIVRKRNRLYDTL